MRPQHLQTIREACIKANPDINVVDNFAFSITRPIRLADVLNAMNSKLSTPFFPTANDWEMFLYHKWDPYKDDLTEQSDECLEFLANLLRA